MCVCLSVCVSASEAINNQWCDIDRVWLVKQVLRLFPLLHMAFSIDKMDGRGHFNTAHRERLPKKTKVMWYVLATKGLPKRQSPSFIKVSGQMHNNAFKRRLAFSFTVIISA